MPGEKLEDAGSQLLGKVWQSRYRYFVDKVVSKKYLGSEMTFLVPGFQFWVWDKPLVIGLLGQLMTFIGPPRSFIASIGSRKTCMRYRVTLWILW